MAPDILGKNGSLIVIILSIAAIAVFFGIFTNAYMVFIIVFIILNLSAMALGILNYFAKRDKMARIAMIVGILPVPVAILSAFTLSNLL